MRLPLTIVFLVLFAPLARGQVKFTLDLHDIIKSTFFTESNADAIVDGLNANVTQGKQFNVRLVPGGSGGVLVGTQAAGSRLSWGSVETFAGQAAAVSVQNYQTQNGLDVHVTGTGGIAIIGESDTGAAAAKFVQTTRYDFPCAFIWRSAATGSSDAALIDLKSPGVADLIRLENASTPQTILDVLGSVHPPHLADSAAQNDSEYFSTTAGKMCYKDSGGAVHPLY